jgi:UDP-N-acetylmuramate dehydrogenase
MDKTGTTRTVGREYMEFAYDYSKLQETGEVVIDAVFRLPHMAPGILRVRADEAFEYRKKTQPMGVATCGCFFRNIDEKDQKRLGLATKSAGFLIDSCGFKNTGIGSFHVSGMHANFIIGDGKGSGNPRDLLQLITDIKKKVQERYGVILREEVVLI